MSYLRTCPRCNDRSYEVLRTHAYCVSCNYSPDLSDRPMSSDDLPIPAWAEEPRNEVRRHDKAEQFVGGAA